MKKKVINPTKNIFNILRVSEGKQKQTLKHNKFAIIDHATDKARKSDILSGLKKISFSDTPGKSRSFRTFALIHFIYQTVDKTPYGIVSHQAQMSVQNVMLAYRLDEL